MNQLSFLANKNRHSLLSRFPFLSRRVAGNEHGANLIEMALVIMLLLLILAGVVDLGRAFYSYIAITNAAREGARYASHVPHLTSGIRAATRDEAANSGITLADDQITIDPDPAGFPAAAGSPVRVEVEYDVRTIMGEACGAGEPGQEEQQHEGSDEQGCRDRWGSRGRHSCRERRRSPGGFIS